MNQSINEELGHLTSQLLDGEISETDHKTIYVVGKLRRQSGTYLEYIRLESLLHWELMIWLIRPWLLKIPKICLLSFPFWAGSLAAVFLAMTAIWWTYQPMGSDNTQSYADHSPTPVSHGLTGW